MKVLNALGLVTRHQAREDAKFRVEASKKHTDAKVTNLENENKKLKKENARYKDDLAECKTKIEVLEARVDESRELVTKEIELGDKEAVLAAMKDGIDSREAKIKDRVARLEEDESDKYKEGYADGVVDGLHKAHEITAEDRKNAMQIAMVSAASHSPAGVANEALRLTASSTEVPKA